MKLKGKKYPQRRLKEMQTCKCVYCRTKYQCIRDDISVYCSSKCKQGAYRERLAVKNAGRLETNPDAPTPERVAAV